MHPHRRRRIGESPAGEGVGGEEMAELIVHVRLGDGHERQEGDACDESCRADSQHCQRPPPRQAAQHALHGLEPR